MGMWGVGKENDGSRDRDRRRRARLERAARSWASDPRALRVGLKRILEKLGPRAGKRLDGPFRARTHDSLFGQECNSPS